MIIQNEIRKVAIKWPETSWAGIQKNSDDGPILMPEGYDSFTLLEVGPIRGNPEGRMIYGTFNLPDEESEQGWEIILKILSHAVEKPVLYAKDFENTTTVLIK